ncbi:unnamed protein product, partial [Porites lobata]
MAATLQKAEMCDNRVHGTPKVKVTILASEWGSSYGGLSTLNRELAIQLAKFPEVEITFFLPKCSQEDRKIALEHKVKIVEATPLTGFEQLNWLCFPPEDLHIDIIVGHGVKLGKQAQVIKNSKNCKWVQVVHTDPEELGMFKSYSNPISKGEEKHKTEVELCKMADRVVGVGPKLSEAFRSYLCGCCKDGNVFEFTPGVFEEFKDVRQAAGQGQRRNVLLFGSGDVEDFELKGFDIAGKAVAALHDTRLVFVGAADGKYEEVKNRFIRCGVPTNRLRVRGFVARESLRSLFQEVDLAVMPSRTEGFGLTGLEAMSAGLPVLASRNSGFGEALRSAAFGSSFVIDSEDSAVWTVAIQNILSKDRDCRLEEAVTLRDSYGRKYNWTKQIKELVDRMITLAHEPSMEIENNQRTNSYDDQQLVSETSLSSDRELKADAASANPTKISTNSDSQSQNSRKRKMSEFSCNSGNKFRSLGAATAKEQSPNVVLSRLLNTGTSSEDSGIRYKKHMPSKIASHEGASSLRKEPLKSWSMQSIPGCTSSTEPCIEIDNNQRTNSYYDEQLVSETSLSSDCEMKADAASGNPTRISTNTDSLSQNSRKRKMSEFPCNPDSVLTTAFIEVIVSSNAQDLTVEQQRTITKELEQLVHKYRRHQDLSSLPFHSSVARLTKYIEKAYEVAVMMVKTGSLIITVQCPTLESLESLWNGYCSGYLNDVVESFLVTDELKRKLGLDKVRLKTTIEEENYLICKKAFMENSGVASITETSRQTVDSGQVEDTRWSEESSDVVKDKKQALTPMARAEKAKDKKQVLTHMERAEKAKASRGTLHKAAISGEYEMVKRLVECGEDVDQRDQISQTPLHLACWYGQESVVKLLLKHGANVNAEDRFQRTPLQNAERQNHHSIVQLLRKNDARLSLHQPASKGSLHRAAVSGQHETVKELLESGEDVYQSDEMSPLPRPDRRPSHSGSESPKEREEESQIVSLPRPDQRPSDSGSESPKEGEEESEESKGSLHRAAVSRQDEMFRDFLETIEDLDLSDEIFPGFGLPERHFSDISSTADSGCHSSIT